MSPISLGICMVHSSPTPSFVPPSKDVQLRKGLKLDTWNMGTEGEHLDNTACIPVLIRIGPLKIAYPATIEDAEQKVEEVGFLNILVKTYIH